MCPSIPSHWPESRPAPCLDPVQLNGEDKRAAEVDRKARERMLELIRFCGNLYNQVRSERG